MTNKNMSSIRPLPFYFWIVSAIAGYIAFFLLFYSLLGESAAIFAFMPPLVVAWVFGMRLGFVAAVLSNVATLALLHFEGLPAWDVASILHRSPGLISVIIIVVIVGYLSELRKRLNRELEVKNKIEMDLRERESMLRGIYLAAPIGISLSINRVMKTVNDGLCKICGFSATELIGNSARMLFIDEAEFERSGRDLYGNNGQGGRADAEARWRRKDGAFIDVSIRTSPLDPKDFSAGQVVTVLDITKRKKAEQLLAESEERFKSIFEGSNDALMLIDEKGFFDCNARTLEMFGFKSKEEFAHVHPADISPPDQPDGRNSFQEAGKRIEEAYRTGSNRFEWIHRKTNGQDFPAEVLLSAFNLNGRRVLQATVRDISKRKNAELALAESEKSFKSMFELTSEGVTVIDPETGRFIAANPAMCALLGYTENEFRALTPEDITPSGAKEIMRNSIKLLLNGGSIEDHEGINMKKDGSSAHVLVRCRPLFWKGKKVFYVTFKDVTFLKEIQRQLEKKNREILEFTYAATHDLKKPLTTLKTVYSLMQTGAFGTLNNDGKEALSMGAEGISYMQELLDDLLTSAQLDTSVQQLALEKIDVRALALDVVARLKYQIDEKKVTVTVSDELGVLQADKKGMTKVFMNLIGNSINYIGIGPDRTIDIGAESAEGEKVYYIRDNGIGIPEETQKTLFQKFKRGTNVSDINGTGLGLLIVKGIIEAHGGKIWAESMVGEGTTFYWTIDAPLTQKHHDLRGIKVQ
jgi:PAS domain S-box-containing protein